MEPAVIMDATPMAGGHGVRGIGAAVRGWVAGFAALPPGGRPALLVSGDATPAGFRLVRINPPRWPLDRADVPDPMPARAARTALRGAPLELFHATQPQLGPPPGMACVETCWDLIPLLFPDTLGGTRRALTRRQHRRYLARLRAARRVIVTSASVADDVVRRAGVDRARVRMVPLGVTPTGGHPRPAARPPYVLYSGALEPHKNVEVLIRALSLSRHPDLRLILTGPWSRRRLAGLRGAIASAGLAPRVDLRGHVTADELRDLRAGATAVAVPSRAEGFGLPALEALAAGVPVITSTDRALGEVTGPEATARVDPDDDAGWARAMDAVADGPAARARAASAGRARAAGFTWDAAAAAVADVYLELA